MSDHAHERGNISEAQMIGHDEHTDEGRDHTLEDVADQSESCGFDSVGTEHIGRAGVTASVLADVVVVQSLGKNDRKADAAEQIRNDNAKNHRKEENRRSPGKAEFSDQSGCQKFSHNKTPLFFIRRPSGG